jgi:pimeloyl-ACP methyl ester carboxylesterase
VPEKKGLEFSAEPVVGGGGAMPTVLANGVALYYETSGFGDPLVLVHGGWGDHGSWRFVVDDLAHSYRVVTYDRRGHSQSERSMESGMLRAHEEDLAALVQELGVAPAHVVGTSIGASIALRLAGRHPEMFRSLCGHEPPSFELLREDPETRPLYDDHVMKLKAVEQLLIAGDVEGGTRLFFETIAFGSGAWEQIPQESRRTFVANAPTFLEEMRDPEQLRIELDSLARFPHSTLLSQGDSSKPEFPPVIAKLVEAMPYAERRTIIGAGHVPHLTHPSDYVALIIEFLSGIA